MPVSVENPGLPSRRRSPRSCRTVWLERALRRHDPAALFLQFLEGHAGRGQPLVEQVLHGVPFLEAFGVEPLGHLEVDLPVGLALPDLHPFLDDLERRPPGPEAVLLREGGRRQDDVGQSHGGGVVKEIHNGDEIELLQRLVVQARPSRLAAQDIGGLDPDALDGVGFPRVDLVDAHVGLGPPPEILHHGIPVRADPLLGEVLSPGPPRTA